MNLFGHLVGHLGDGGSARRKTLYLHRTTHHRKTRTHIHASSGIWRSSKIRNWIQICIPQPSEEVLKCNWGYIASELAVEWLLASQGLCSTEFVRYNACHIRHVVQKHGSCSGSPGFLSRDPNQLFWLKFIVIFHSPSREISSSTTK
jgi:hypothetical protein